jgi:hypothetical protein
MSVTLALALFYCKLRVSTAHIIGFKDVAVPQLMVQFIVVVVVVVAIARYLRQMVKDSTSKTVQTARSETIG